LLKLYIDADGNPMKEETYQIGLRHGLFISVVANKWLQTPKVQKIEMVVVQEGFDAADDWIEERIEAFDIVITSDILLAHRCLQKGACALGAKGYEFTLDNIGHAVAQRELSSHLRALGTSRGGPAPFDKKDRSRFLAKLEDMIQSIKRKQGR
jgi:uncharacterized protein YaiI (UPF0178 family)